MPSLSAVRTERPSIAEIARDVLAVEARALAAMAEALPEGFDTAVEMIRAMTGRLVVSGMGKSGHVARKIAATLVSTGTPAIFLHPAEASHGDLGMIGPGDVCLCLSNSGETAEMKDIVAFTRRFSVPLIAITRVGGSTIDRAADVTLLLPDAPEACAIGLAPTTSTTLAMALGDALAVTLMRLAGFRRETFAAFHPGGQLGARLLNVAAIMRTGDEMPVVGEDTPMGEAIVEMTAKGWGIAAVVDGGRVTGIITDGDLRRNLDGLMTRRAGEVATRTPRTIAPDALASEALAAMQANKVTALFAIDEEGRPVGLLRLHDCLRAGLV